MVARTTLLSLLLLGLLAACAAPATPANAPAASSAADLSGVKSYLLDKGAALSASASDLQTASARYYDLAQTTGFDYATLAADPAQAAKRCPTPRQPGWLPARSTNRWRASWPVFPH